MSSLARFAAFDSVPARHKHNISPSLAAKLARLSKASSVGVAKTPGVFGICRQCHRKGRVKQNRRMYTHNNTLIGDKCTGSNQFPASITSVCPAGHTATYEPESMRMLNHHEGNFDLCGFSGGRVRVDYKGNIDEVQSPVDGWVAV